MATRVIINKAALNKKYADIKRAQITKINRSGILKTVLTGLQKEIRKGINPKTGQKYKPLAKSTKDYRKFYASVASTHPDFRANKANVTFSGQLIDALKARITAFRSKIVVLISVTGEHQGHALKRGGKTKNISNAELVDHLEDAGYPVLAISKNRLKNIKNKIVRLLNR